jgi:hypothetical protein
MKRHLNNFMSTCCHSAQIVEVAEPIAKIASLRLLKKILPNQRACKSALIKQRSQLGHRNFRHTTTQRAENRIREKWVAAKG